MKNLKEIWKFLTSFSDFLKIFWNSIEIFAEILDIWILLVRERSPPKLVKIFKSMETWKNFKSLMNFSRILTWKS